VGVDVEKVRVSSAVVYQLARRKRLPLDLTTLDLTSLRPFNLAPSATQSQASALRQGDFAHGASSSNPFSSIVPVSLHMRTAVSDLP
jgi:hypothetical protein